MCEQDLERHQLANTWRDYFIAKLWLYLQTLIAESQMRKKDNQSFSFKLIQTECLFLNFLQILYLSVVLYAPSLALQAG